MVESQPLDHPFQMRAPLFGVAVSHGGTSVAPSQLDDHVENLLVLGKEPEDVCRSAKRTGRPHDPLVDPPIHLVPKPRCTDALRVLPSQQRLLEQYAHDFSS